MKKYIQPAIHVQKIETESLMAASLGINNDYSGQPQRSKEHSFDDFDDNEQQPGTFPGSAWDDDEQE